MVQFLKVLPMLCCLSSFAQGELAPLWVKTVGGPSIQAEAWGIAVDQADNVYWAVSSNGQNQELDILGYKYNINGDELWPTPFIYGGAGTQQAYVCTVDDSTLYIGGRHCTGLVNTCDMLLVKVDKSSGTLIWDATQNFQANGYDEVDGLEITSNGIYTGGWCQSIDGNIYRSDIGLWHLDFNGNTEWTTSIGDSLTAEHQDGHFVVKNNTIYAAGLWGGSGIANLYNGHAFLGAFNQSDGSLQDSVLFGHQSPNFNDIENALGMTTDGHFLYITGYSTPVTANDWQIFVAKFDFNLNMIWYTDWGGTATESARAIAVQNGVIYIGGVTESPELMTGGERDALLLRLDTAGNLINYKTYGGLEKESWYDLAIQGNRLYLTGVVESPGFQKSAQMVAVDLETLSLAEQDLNPVDLTLWPNPANGEVTVSLSQPITETAYVSIYNAEGKLVSEQILAKGSKSCHFNLTMQGLYYVNMTSPQYRMIKPLVNLK